MILLQIIPKEVPNTTEGILWIMFSLCIGIIIWLALWLRKINNERAKDHKETREILVKIVEKNTDGFHEMKTAIQMNTEATKNGAEQMRGANERLSNAVENLNRDIRNHEKR